MRLQLVQQPLLGHDVRLGVGELDGPVGPHRDPVVGPRQVLRGQPEVDGVARDVVERPLRRQPRLQRLLAPVHLRRGLADHLDVAQRVVDVVGAEVEVVEARASSGRRSGSAPATAPARPGCCGTCSCARPGRTRWQARPGCASDAEASSSLALFAAPQETTTRSPVNVSRSPSRSTTTPVTVVPAAFVSSFTRLGVGEQRDVVVLERRAHAEHLGVGLRVHEAREAVARRAAHAGAVGHVVLGEHHPAGRVERVAAERLEVVGELLDARLVADRGERVRRAAARLGRVLPTRAVDVVEPLGLRVVRLELVVGDRPRGRHAVVVAQLAEVLGPQPVQRRPVELRRAADEVVHLRLERLAVGVVPGVLGDVAVVDEHVVCGPVGRLTREPVTALEEQDALAGRRQVVDEGPAAGAAADHDDVVASSCRVPPLVRRG